MSSIFKSKLLVIAQFSTFVLIILSGPLVAVNPLLFLIQLIAIFLGCWSIYTMSRYSTFKIAPIPHQQAKLVQTGPYRYLRHPMYTAVILGFGAMVFSQPTPYRLLLWLILISIHVIKLNFEEKLLAQRFSDYPDYRQHTYRLIPFIF